MEMGCMKINKKMIRFLLVGFLLFWININDGICEKQLIIVQVSDPQIGFYSENGDYSFENDRFNAAVEKINQLNPDFVIFTGDMIHNIDSLNQQIIFDNITKRINNNIKTLYIPGNHDVNHKNGSVDMTLYKHRYNYDRFAKISKDVLLVGLNSVLIKDEKIDSQKELEQFEWLDLQLKKNENVKTKIIFVHHPFFLKKFDEANGYMTIDQDKRKLYFDMFLKYSVNVVFAGHLHDNSEAAYNGIEMITTSALIRQLGKSEPGVRLIIVDKGNVQSKYYTIEAIPVDKKNIILE